uniref:Uncharacterized protein n=1 Tax=Onchocerca volvulus TaxID=6282 RepID=A0A8R1TR90_ONCVO
MKLFEHKQQELQRISAEIHRLSQGNPQQQRKCVRLKEDYERLMQELQKLQENQNKDKIRLDELRKQIEQIEASEGNEESKKRKRKKLKKEYEELRKKLNIGEEFKENAERINGSNGSNENTFSFKSAEKIYLNEQHPEVKPVQKDQYGVYEQIRNIKTIEERMLKRKKIESEAEDTFTIRTASLCELEADIDNVRKRMASPVIQKFEEELKLIRKKSSKDTKMLKREAQLERRIDKIDRTREICVTAIAGMNLTTKRMFFDLMGFVVNILRTVLYIIAWIRDLLIYYTENI